MWSDFIGSRLRDGLQIHLIRVTSVTSRGRRWTENPAHSVRCIRCCAPVNRTNRRSDPYTEVGVMPFAAASISAALNAYWRRTRNLRMQTCVIPVLLAKDVSHRMSLAWEQQSFDPLPPPLVAPEMAQLLTERTPAQATQNDLVAARVCSGFVSRLRECVDDGRKVAAYLVLITSLFVRG